MARLREFCSEIEVSIPKKLKNDEPFHLDYKKCGKEILVLSESFNHADPSLATEVTQVLQCGHTRTISKEVWLSKSDRTLEFQRLLPFQKEAVEFAERCGLRAIIADEMGLGKTVESLLVLRENPEAMLPCLILCQAGDIYRWEDEATEFLGLNNPDNIFHLGKDIIKFTPQVYSKTGQTLSKAFQVVVASWTRLSDAKFLMQLKRMGLKSIIIDEFHMYKNTQSARTRNLQDLVKELDAKAPLLFLSGTPITNRVMEWFVPLNILDPNYFPSPHTLRSHCLIANDGKSLTLAPWNRDRFLNRLASYTIRRTKAQVGIPLPTLKRETINLSVTEWRANESIVKRYNDVLDSLEEEMNKSRPDTGNIMGYMSQLRRYTGEMKILGVANYIEDWIAEHPNEKLCVGLHHINVRETLARLLAKHNPLQMSSEAAEVKDEIERQFRNGHNLLLASIVSAGQGRNFQFCKNAIIMERQWNKAREDQFEQRFHRIIRDEFGRVKTQFTEADDVNIVYINGYNTFDEYFDNMVHLKGLIVDSADSSVDGDDIPDEDFIMELANAVVKSRIKWVGV